MSPQICNVYHSILYAMASLQETAVTMERERWGEGGGEEPLTLAKLYNRLKMMYYKYTCMFSLRRACTHFSV